MMSKHCIHYYEQRQCSFDNSATLQGIGLHMVPLISTASMVQILIYCLGLFSVACKHILLSWQLL